MSYKLRSLDYVVFALVVALAYLFTAMQHYFIPVAFRPLALLGVIVILLTAFFFWVKPDSPIALAQWLSLCLAIVVLALIVINHVIVRFDLPAVKFKVAVIFGVSVISPFLAAAVYAGLKRKRK